MTRWLLVFLFSVNLWMLCFTGNLTAAQVETQMELSTGYRVDDLDWNIAGNIVGTNPNILSELTWSDLQILQASVSGNVLINKAFYLRGSFGFGWAFDGDNQDSDYNGDNRTLEFSRSNNKADDSYVFDASAGLGYQFTLVSGRLRLIPLVGYAYNQQNLTLTDGFQTISLPPQTQPLGPIPNLDSTYDTRWYGPWLGVDLFYNASEKISLFAGFEYHWADYKAEAFWNLRANPNFEHEADGEGFVISFGGDYVFAEPWSMDEGVDRQAGVPDKQLNEVNWESFAIMLTLKYRFWFLHPR
jgi:hypothetical protein